VGYAPHLETSVHWILLHVVVGVEETNVAVLRLLHQIDAATERSHPNAPTVVYVYVVNIVVVQRVFVRRVNVLLQVSFALQYEQALPLRSYPNTPLPVFLDGINADSEHRWRLLQLAAAVEET